MQHAVVNRSCQPHRYRLHERMKVQLLELLKGFTEVVPEPFLSVFDFQEIELLLCGLPNIDMDDWIVNSDYTGDFASQGRNHKVVQWFWEVRVSQKSTIRASNSNECAFIASGCA